MSVEKGFIEYEFTQTGAEQVSRSIQKLDKETEDLTKGFIEYEKQVRGVSNTERDMARETQRLSGSTKDASGNQDKFNSSLKTSRDQMLSGRYALYDLASTYAAIGAALAGVGVYATVMGANFESAFTNVERTLNPMEAAAVGIDNIRNSLINMTGEIPLAFDEISQIAMLGNQLGIAAEDLVSFTDTVAKFSAATGISVEQTALAFGQLGNLLGVSAEYYVNMASAIALVGVNSAATEEQIVSIAREIAPAARAAGLAADEVIGLSGALGSIRVPPERSRSTILQFFETLNAAAAEGGDKLKNFATVVGTSVEELDAMVRAGQGADILTNFLGTLSASDTIEITQALDALGLAGLRVNPTMRALANNMNLLDRTMNDARTGFEQGSELNRQYEKTLNDLNTQWIIFINGLNALVATISGGAVESMAGLLMGVNKLIFGFRQWLVDNPWAARILAIGGAIITVVGIMALMRGASFALRASMLAYLFVAQQTGVANMGLFGTLRAVSGQLAATDIAARRASVGLRIFRGALMATGIGLAVAGIGFLGEQLLNLGGEAEDASIDYDAWRKSVEASENAHRDAAGSAGNLADQLGGGGSDSGVAGAAKEAAKQVRLLTDYAQDLSSIFSRAIELRFSSQSAMDNVTLKWIELNEEVEEYRRQIRFLTADRELKAYWLSIAEAYKDQLRAGQLREELAKVDDDLAKANAGASRELVGQSRSAIENRKVMTELVDKYEDYIVALARSGASQQFIQDEIRRLNREFVDQGTALGYNASELDDYAISFTDMATIVAQTPVGITIGFDPNIAQQAMNEFFARAQIDAAAAGNAAGGGFGGGFGGSLDDFIDDYYPDYDFSEEAAEGGKDTGKAWWDEWAESWARGEFMWIPILGTFMTEIGRWWLDGGKQWAVNAWNGFVGWLTYLWNSNWNLLRAMFNIESLFNAGSRGNGGGGGRGFATGGYTGSGHWLKPTGVVHAGEYVIPKKYVDQRTKLPSMDYVASLSRGQKASRGIGYAGGGFVGGAQPVRVVGGSLDLGARTMQGMSSLGGTAVSIGDRIISEAAASGNRASAMTGSA